jgi:hypothetical protein
MKTTTRHLPRLALFALGAFFAANPLLVTAAEKSAEAVKPYPLKLCIVTDNDLGSMGDERSFVYEGQEIKICCKPCEKKFLKNPAKYLVKLAPAASAPAPAAPAGPAASAAPAVPKL